MSLVQTNPFSDPFSEASYRRTYCKPNSTKIDGASFWTTLKTLHEAHPPQEWPEWGIRFKRFAVLPLSEINITQQFARVFVTESDHVSSLEHSFLLRGWDVGQPLIAVGNTKQIQKVCPPTMEVRNVTEEHIGVVGKHRITALRNLVSRTWTSAAADPHDWRTVFSHILVGVYEYDSPTALYAHDMLTNKHGLPSKSTTPKDVENALRHLTERGFLTNQTPEGLARIEQLIDTVSPHLRERDRKNIKNQHRATVVTKRGESIRPISNNQKRLDEVKMQVFEPLGVPKDKRYLTESGRLTRPLSKGLVAWGRRYEETGETTPVVVAGYLPLNKTTEKTHASLAETRRMIQRTAADAIADHASAFVTLFEYVLSKVPQGRTWVSLDRHEQAALVQKWFPVRFVDFVAQNDAPNPEKNGAKMEPEHTLVTMTGKPSTAVQRSGYVSGVSSEFASSPVSSVFSGSLGTKERQAVSEEYLTRLFSTTSVEESRQGTLEW